MVSKKLPSPKPLQLDINHDSTPILYTDLVLLSTNQFGVVFNVCQHSGNQNQPRIVARVGMSREHAKKLANELGRLLAMTEAQFNHQTKKSTS